MFFFLIKKYIFLKQSDLILYIISSIVIVYLFIDKLI